MSHIVLRHSQEKRDRLMRDVMQAQEAFIAQALRDYSHHQSVSAIELVGYVTQVGVLWERYIYTRLGITDDEWCDAIQRLL